MYGYPSTIWTDRNCYFIVSPTAHIGRDFDKEAIEAHQLTLTS